MTQTVHLKLEDMTRGTIFEGHKSLRAGSCTFYLGTRDAVDILLPLQEYRDLGQKVATVYVTATNLQLSYFRENCSVDGQSFRNGELPLGAHDVTMESHRFRMTVTVAAAEPELGGLRYRIYHPSDAPSVPNRRSAVIRLDVGARDETGDVKMEGDASVIERAREVVAMGPGGSLSTEWLTRIHPEELQRGMRHSAFAAFRPELLGGAEILTRRAPPRLSGDAQAEDLARTFATDLVFGLAQLDRMYPDERPGEIRRLDYKIWGFQHWRPTLESSQAAAAAIARRLPEKVAREQERYAHLLQNRGRRPSAPQPLLRDGPITEEQALALARALVAAYEAASLEDPGAMADDLRRRVLELKLA